LTTASPTGPSSSATPASPTSPSSRSRSPTAPPARSWSSRATSSARSTTPPTSSSPARARPSASTCFGDTGEAVAFLAEALRNLIQREPTASVALITRYPQQADVYHDALRIAEVPKLRRVGRQDFSFTPGIDVTDVRQVKGLEFDYVVILDPTSQNYPEVVESRHLLHIAATRAAHQLWLLCAGPVIYAQGVATSRCYLEA
jgi:hypothetical protein